jgi:DNA polymerase-3 subunit alpha
VDLQAVNKRAVEALVKCGALASTGVSRKGLLENEGKALDLVLGWGSQHQGDRLAGQGSIFDLGEETSAQPRHHPPIATDEYEKSMLLSLEKESLGVYVSEHPLTGIREALRRKTDAQMVELERRRDGDVVTVGGIVGALKQTTTKKGEPMVFMRLDDVSGSVEAIVFNSVYGAARGLLETDRVLILKGRVDHKEGETKLIAMEVVPFEATPERSEVLLKLDARKAPAGTIRELAELLRGYPGETAVLAAIETSSGPLTLAFGPEYRVRPEPDLFAEVKSLLGEAAIS